MNTSKEIVVIISMIFLFTFIFFLIKKQKSLKRKFEFNNKKRILRNNEPKNSVQFKNKEIIPYYIEPLNKLLDDILKIDKPINSNKSGKIDSVTKDIYNTKLLCSTEFVKTLIKQKNLYDINILSFTEFTAYKKDYISSINKFKVDESKEDFLLGISSLVTDGILSTEELSEIKSIISNNLI